jgi:hypothetical protein
MQRGNSVTLYRQMAVLPETFSHSERHGARKRNERNETDGCRTGPYAVQRLRCTIAQPWVRQLRDFDEKLLMTHPCEYLRMEDERLVRLDNETEMWWNGMRRSDTI